MADNILRVPAVIQKTGLSRSTLYLRLSENRFPQPVRLGGERAIGFLASEVEQWIAEQAAKRGDPGSEESHERRPESGQP